MGYARPSVVLQPQPQRVARAHLRRLGAVEYCDTHWKYDPKGPSQERPAPRLLFVSRYPHWLRKSLQCDINMRVWEFKGASHWWIDPVTGIGALWEGWSIDSSLSSGSFRCRENVSVHTGIAFPFRGIEILVAWRVLEPDPTPFTFFLVARAGWSLFHLILRGTGVACILLSRVGSGDGSTTGRVDPLNRPRCATPVEKRIRPGPEHSIPFFWHFLHVGSALSHIIRRLEHWKQPIGDVECG